MVLWFVLAIYKVEAAPEPRTCSESWLSTLQHVLGFRSKKKALLVEAELRACAGGRGGWLGEHLERTVGLRRLVGPYLGCMACGEAVAAMAVLQEYVSVVGGRDDCVEEVVA